MKKLIRKIINYSLLIIISYPLSAQLNWKNVDSLYQPLPASVHVYKTRDSLDGKPNIAFYVIADLKGKSIFFDTDTTFQRRFTPTQFYMKNNKPLVVVNTTFFSFATNQNLNVVMKKGKLLAYNVQSLTAPGNRDTANEYFPFRSAIGIKKNRTVDIAWLFSDSARRWPVAFESGIKPIKISSLKNFEIKEAVPKSLDVHTFSQDEIRMKWKMKTAVGGGPVLLQRGKIYITNEEEMMFMGKRIDEREPRTAMGYTMDNRLIILVVQGRFPGIAEGASLRHEAKIFQDLGCWEALNLDGGGSTCMLINGKETVKPAGAAGQRAVPAVFLIRNK